VRGCCLVVLRVGRFIDGRLNQMQIDRLDASCYTFIQVDFATRPAATLCPVHQTVLLSTLQTSSTHYRTPHHSKNQLLPESCSDRQWPPPHSTVSREPVRSLLSGLSFNPILADHTLTSHSLRHLMGKAKMSKALLLEEWNASKGTPLLVGSFSLGWLMDDRCRTGRTPIPPLKLLRESLYLLQGISGSSISFFIPPPDQVNPYLLPPHHFSRSPNLSTTSAEDEGPLPGQLVFNESEGYVGKLERGLVERLGETGWLVRNVESFVKEVQEMGAGGAQSGEPASKGGVRRGGLVEQVRTLLTPSL
jgi:hypothetical protein